MQLIPICLFTIIFGYSLVISAPVNQTTSDTQEAKHQKATAIAHRLLKELAGEQQHVSHQQEENAEKDESKDTIIPVNRPGVEKVQSHIEKPIVADDDVVDGDNDDEENYDFMPTLDDLYEIYANKYAQVPDDDDDDESSLEINDGDYILPISTQQLLRYLAEQEENNEPVVHTPVMDDTIMKAENHRRRRRSLY